MPTTTAAPARRARRRGAAVLTAVTLAVAASATGPGAGGNRADDPPGIDRDAGDRDGAGRAARLVTTGTAVAVAEAFGPAGTVSVALAAVPTADAAGPAGTGCGGSVPLARAGTDGPVATASLVKLYVIAELLHRQRAGLLVLDEGDRAAMTAMARTSDDAAASQLWDRHGGGQLVSDVAARYGLAGTAPPQDPGQWGQTTTTAGDVACFLALLPTVAGPEDSRTVLDWMRMAAPIAADGFDQRFGLFGADGAAVKQGWSCCLSGTRLLHSAGVVDGVAVALLASAAPEVGYPQVAQGLTAAATALTERSC